MKRNKLKSTLLLASICFCLVFCLSPFVYMGAVSLSERVDFLSGQSSFSFTWENFRRVICDPSLHFVDYLRNSMTVSLLAALFCVAIASLAAYAITRLKLPGKMYILLFALALSMFPQIGLVGYLFKLTSKLGWINTYQGLLFPYIAWILPLSLWILVSYFSQIPSELDDAALVDGCTYRQSLCKVILPVAAPGILSVLLLCFIFAFNEFMFALMLTTDYKARTIPVGIALFQGLHGQTPWGDIMAASVITTAPVVILAALFQRRIVAGLTRGAVKG